MRNKSKKVGARDEYNIHGGWKGGGGSVVCVCVDCPVDDELSVLC